MLQDNICAALPRKNVTKSIESGKTDVIFCRDLLVQNSALDDLYSSIFYGSMQEEVYHILVKHNILVHKCKELLFCIFCQSCVGVCSH